MKVKVRGQGQRSRIKVTKVKNVKTPIFRLALGNMVKGQGHMGQSQDHRGQGRRSMSNVARVKVKGCRSRSKVKVVGKGQRWKSHGQRSRSQDQGCWGSFLYH